MSEKELPERVRDARTARGMTQAEFAEVAGVKHRAYQNFENGVSRPQPANLRKILRAAGIDPEDEKGDRPGDIDGDLKFFLKTVQIWLSNMDPATRQRMIGELTRRIVSGDFTQMGIARSSVSRG